MSLPYWPRSSWLAIVQTSRYSPGASVTLIGSRGLAGLHRLHAARRGPARACRRPSSGGTWTARLCVRRPVLRTTNLIRPAAARDDVLRDDPVLVERERRIGRSVRNVSPAAAAAQGDRRGGQQSGCEAEAGHSPDALFRMICAAHGPPLSDRRHASPPRRSFRAAAARRAWRSPSRRSEPRGRGAVRRALRRLPHADGRRNAGLGREGHRQGERRRPELRHAQGDRRGRRVRDRERRLLRRDHAREHRDGRREAGHRASSSPSTRARRSRRRRPPAARARAAPTTSPKAADSRTAAPLCWTSG